MGIKSTKYKQIKPTTLSYSKNINVNDDIEQEIKLKNDKKTENPTSNFENKIVLSNSTERSFLRKSKTSEVLSNILKNEECDIVFKDISKKNFENINNVNTFEKNKDITNDFLTKLKIQEEENINLKTIIKDLKQSQNLLYENFENEKLARKSIVDQHLKQISNIKKEQFQLIQENESLKADLQRLRDELFNRNEEISIINKNHEQNISKINREYEILVERIKKDNIENIQSLNNLLEMKEDNIKELKITLSKCLDQSEFCLGLQNKVNVLNQTCENLKEQLFIIKEREKNAYEQLNKLDEGIKTKIIENKMLKQENEMCKWKINNLNTVSKNKNTEKLLKKHLQKLKTVDLNKIKKIEDTCHIYEMKEKIEKHSSISYTLEWSHRKTIF